MGTQYEDVATFAEAKAKCNSDGARLWQPRNEDAWNNLMSLESKLLSSPQGHFPFHSPDNSFIAIGLEIKIDQYGEAVAYYPDGAKVPENLIGRAFVWDTLFPENNADKTCVALIEGKLRNVVCNSYEEGTFVWC